MRETIRKSMTAIALAALSAAPAAADCPGLTVFGLTDDQRLVRFRECDPEKLKEVGYITGLSGDDEALVGVDFRVQDGRLYGVGDGGGVYVLDTKTAAATFASQITIDLDGTNFGVDFNPAADRLRIISDAGQNLRHNVIPGFVTLLDSALNYTAGTTATGISGAAYTNNDLATDTATTLFDLDGSLDQVAIQSPPNNGSLAAAGKLVVDTAAPIGFDIYTRLHKGVAAENRGFASLVVDGTPAFYRIDLLTGKAKRIGKLKWTLIDFSVRLDS